MTTSENKFTKKEVMDIINELRIIQDWIDENTICDMTFDFRVHNIEIMIEITIYCGFDTVYNISKNFNACDWETNYSNCVQLLTDFEFKKYKNINSENYKEWI